MSVPGSSQKSPEFARLRVVFSFKINSQGGSLVNGTHILLADDEPDILRGLARILEVRGFVVHQATEGFEAVEHARNHRPPVALLDIMMPGLNGLEAFRRIRALCPEVRVIFMTGYCEFQHEALDEGAVAVLEKPIDLEVLFRTLENLRQPYPPPPQRSSRRCSFSHAGL